MLDEPGIRQLGLTVEAIQREQAVDLTACNFLRATVYCPKGGSLMARAVLTNDAGNNSTSSGWIHFTRRREVRSLDFALVPPSDPRPSDRLMIEFQGTSGPVALCEVALGYRSPSALMAPVSAPTAVRRKDGVITAAGLVEGQTWKTTIDASPRSRLSLAFAVPHEFKRVQDPQATHLKIRLKRGRKETVKVVQAVHSSDWVDVSVPLSKFGYGPVDVEMSLHGDNDAHTAILMIGDLVVVTPIESPRTVVLITSDTHRVDYIGSSAQTPRAKTPVIDALAKRGVQFDNCYSTTNVTSPSHVAIMTGVHPKDTGIVNNHTRMADHAETLAEAFARAGYRTMAATSVGHLTPAISGLDQGFDRFSPPSGTRVHATEAIQALTPWIDDCEGSNLFVWLHIFDAHAPYFSKGQKEASANPGSSRQVLTPEILDGNRVAAWLQSSPALDVDEVRGWYGQEVEEMDSELEAFLSHPRLADAWIAFTADHGENLGEHQSWFRHTGLFQPTLHVPMILTGPGVPVRRSAAQVQQVDVGRTLLGLAGITADFPGTSLMTSLEEPERERPRFALAAHANQASLASGRWLLVMDLVTEQVDPSIRFYEAGRVRLFDLTLGVTSDQNFFDEEPAVVRRLAKRLVEWLESPREQPMDEAVELTAEQSADLIALGYSGPMEREPSGWWHPEKIKDPQWVSFHAQLR
ncbi:MAG: arylsulfatase A-like enzyme [Planctomycetota bacterium]|jgi:arylsulfatase A-like enzyme